MKTLRPYIYRLVLLLVMANIMACNKADQYYNELFDKPELMEYDYRSTYEIGDTMTLYGRLHLDKNITLRIGNADVPIVEKGTVGLSPLDTPEFIKFVISEPMGVGNNRPVRITAGKASLDAPAINIYSSAGAGYLKDKLALEQYHVLPTAAIFLNSVNGNGHVWYWANNGIYRVKPDGETTNLLQAADLVDTYGNFEVSRFYSGAIDPAERYLYFSVLTTDASADNIRNNIYRLCRFDLEHKSLVTLNRSLVRKGAVQNIMTTAPLEGNIDEINLSPIGQMFAASSGDLYLQPRIMVFFEALEQQYATLRLTTAGKLSYLLKTRVNSEDHAIALLPGTSIPEYQGLIDADAGLMFTQSRDDMNTISGYNLQLKIQSNMLTTVKMPNVPFPAAPVIYGDFSALSGDPTITSNSGAPARFGFMPIGQGRLTVLYFQGYEDNKIFMNFPRLGILDFPKGRGDAYSPGKLETAGFTMKSRSSSTYGPSYIYNNNATVDKLLNHDPDGMLYMSANNRQVLVKTVKQ